MTELPKLPDGLKKLDCAYNKLVELPELPVNIEKLRCHNNNIKYLSPSNCLIVKNIKLGIMNNPVSSGFNSDSEFKAYLE